MMPTPLAPAAISQPAPQALVLSGCWSARGLGPVGHQLQSLRLPKGAQARADGAHIVALDTAGAWLLQQWLERLRAEGA
ncbi:MAG: hypothetical protein H7306_00335, partial [Bacteriovorax sp.]|nr:hypothetical protein [Rhizobacter sp.]